MTNEDLAIIDNLNKRLKRLEDLYFSKGQETKQPIDTTEGEYVRCVEWNGELYTAGKIYHVVNGIIIDNSGDNDDYAHLIKHQPFFEPATHAEFLAQEQAPIETEQRWLVNVERTYDHLNEYRIIVELDEKNGLNKERADKAAEAIKKYLTTNQF
jgi:hypothetical protein